MIIGSASARNSSDAELGGLQQSRASARTADAARQQSGRPSPSPAVRVPALPASESGSPSPGAPREDSAAAVAAAIVTAVTDTAAVAVTWSRATAGWLSMAVTTVDPQAAGRHDMVTATRRSRRRPPGNGGHGDGRVGIHGRDHRGPPGGRAPRGRRRRGEGGGDPQATGRPARRADGRRASRPVLVTSLSRDMARAGPQRHG